MPTSIIRPERRFQNKKKTTAQKKYSASRHSVNYREKALQDIPITLLNKIITESKGEEKTPNGMKRRVITTQAIHRKRGLKYL